jgi:tRNA A-37 threonylcarbamoyl transferase component Bud32
MSWKEKVVGLYKRFGSPVKFAAKLVLGSVVPGGSAVVDLVGLALDCVHETVRDQIELDEAKMPAVSAADLQRLEDMLAVLGGGDLGGLMAKVAALESRPDLAAQTLALAQQNDARCQAALHKLDQLARGIEGLHGKADQMNAKLDELLRRNHVPPSSQPQYHISITDEREKALLLRLRSEYRGMGAEQRQGVDLSKLGDALRAAGLPAEAKESYAEAAAATADRSEQAANHYKEYLADLEQRRWDDALAAAVKAATLDAKFALFPLSEYSPKRIVGAGGFGAAFLCHDPHMDQHVVVKSLHETELDRRLTDVFGEAKVLLQLSRTHPVIIGVQRCSFADVTGRSRPYIVMDYFPGASLQDYLDQMKTPLGLALPDFLAIAVPVAKGMRAVHARGVFHRDLKPDNVLVLKKGERWNMRIIDFGLAVRGRVVRTSVNRPVSERNYLGAGVAGTAKYAPPEQMGELPDVPVGPYSDVFAFGKLCLYMLFKTTGPLERHWKTLPAEARDGLRELLEKCTEHSPADRHQSFEPVVQRLEALAAPEKPKLLHH